MFQARREGRHLMRVVMGKDNAGEFQTFWQRTSRACWWVRSREDEEDRKESS